MKILFAIFALCGAVINAIAASFINLDFELANTNNASFRTGFLGPTVELLPGWTVEYYGQFATNILYDFLPAGTATAAAVFPKGTLGTDPLLTGNYCFGGQIASYVSNNRFITEPIFLSQVGDVPAFAIKLNVSYSVPPTDFTLATYVKTFLNGTEIVDGDISEFAGVPNVRLELEITKKPPLDALDLFFLYRVEFVVIDPPPTTPRISQASITNGTNGFSFYWSADVASKYQVESATNIPAAWQPVGSPVTSTNGTFYFTDPSATNQLAGQRFYRLRTVP